MLSLCKNGGKCKQTTSLFLRCANFNFKLVAFACSYDDFFDILHSCRAICAVTVCIQVTIPMYIFLIGMHREGIGPKNLELSHR